MSLFGPHAALPDREGRCAKLSEGDRPSVPRNGNRGFGGRTGREACRAFALTRTWDRSALQFISHLPAVRPRDCLDITNWPS